ncbi:MAG: hypothetical protein WC516_06055 [Patescibacteria group bacterium]|jgi:DNA ligase-1
MKEKPFRPMKAPNEQLPGNTAYEKACNLTYPILGSDKYDGFRCIFYEGQQRTASLKPFNNIHINKKFQPIVNFINQEMSYKPLFDGELMTPSLPFNVFSGIFRSDEMILPEDTKFYMFDGVYCDKFDEQFKDRQWYVEKASKAFPELIVPVEQKLLNSPEEVVAYYEEALSKSFIYNEEEHFICDGLILRSLDGHYKKGRGTLKEGLIYKLKPYQDFDAKIIDVIEGTKVDINAEKKINEMGYSETSRKKGDRILGGWACDFVVLHENKKPLKVSIAESKEKKIEIWNNKEYYIGKTLEYKGLLVGAKDLPRHATSIRLRPDKD